MAFPYSPVPIIGREEYVACPFNSLHRMCSSSLQRHVIRCMKNYPNYVSCPYNGLHWFKTAELLKNHIQECPCKPNYIEPENKGLQKELTHFQDVNKLRKINKELEDWDDV